MIFPHSHLLIFTTFPSFISPFTYPALIFSQILKVFSSHFLFFLSHFFYLLFLPLISHTSPPSFPVISANTHWFHLIFATFSFQVYPRFPYFLFSQFPQFFLLSHLSFPFTYPTPPSFFALSAATSPSIHLIFHTFLPSSSLTAPTYLFPPISAPAAPLISPHTPTSPSFPLISPLIISLNFPNFSTSHSPTLIQPHLHQFSSPYQSYVPDFPLSSLIPIRSFSLLFLPSVLLLFTLHLFSLSSIYIYFPYFSPISPKLSLLLTHYPTFITLTSNLNSF